MEGKNLTQYTGKAWKHHIAADYENWDNSIPTGAAYGSTIFTNYDKMLDYLRTDGRHWAVAELDLEDATLLFEFGNDYMATILQNSLSKEGFKPIFL